MIRKIFVIYILLSGLSLLKISGEEKPPAPNRQETVQPLFKYGEYVFTKRKIKIRSGAGKSFPEIGSIDSGEEVFIDEEKPKNEETLYGITAPWYPVRYGKKTGWVFGGFLYKGDPFMQNSTDQDIFDFLDGKELRTRNGFLSGNWYHKLELGKDGGVWNSCVGECGQSGKGEYSVKNKVIKIDFGADGERADFRSAECKLFKLGNLKGIHCGFSHVYYFQD